MGGEGSIQGMIISLRNNKNLLRGRTRGFFKRELSYAEIRRFYKESEQALPNKRVDKEHLKKIRTQLIAKRKRETSLAIILSIIVLFITSLALYALLSSTQKQDSEIQDSLFQKNLKQYNLKESIYLDRVDQGIRDLNRGDYFYAIGNFENALRKKPNTLFIEILHAEACCLFCIQKHQDCKKASQVLDEYLAKYPNNKDFQEISKRYKKRITKLNQE